MPGDLTRETQNAWANLIFEVRPDFYIGIEYHYGCREVVDGTQGDNHRIQTTLSYVKQDG